MKNTIVGYPRVGGRRELKFWTEDYFKGAADAKTLLANAKELRRGQWELQAKSGIDLIPSNDFSFYDGMLDTAFLLNAIPRRYRDLGLDMLGTYFAPARGYQGAEGDVKAFSMRKWFNTNYHYMVPELDDDTALSLAGEKVFDEYLEAKALGIQTKPVLIGPFTFLKLAKYTGEKTIADFTGPAVRIYGEILRRLGQLGAQWVQIDEPVLVTDLSKEDIALFAEIYKTVLAQKGGLRVLLQTYFGDIRDGYETVISLPFDGVGLDFLEGKRTLELIERYGFPQDKILFAGLVNGKNIWKSSYEKVFGLLGEIKKTVPADRIVLNTSCSLLHVPYSVKYEDAISDSRKALLAFAEEKLSELSELSALADDENYENNPAYQANAALLQSRGEGRNAALRQRIDTLTDRDFTRLPAFSERRAIQAQEFGLPLLPTTTIGSFPQTAEVKSARARFKKGELSAEQYRQAVKEKIAGCIRLQEEIGLDVLVHGEFERNDMVEHFGENLDGYLFTKNAWVQSYGTRCVKPPIIWGDVTRSKPITVEYSAYAQSLTEKPVKGMLTGPVTILNWSFPREDISLKEMALQIALAIREEVLDLEQSGIRIIQVDEAALKEKLPIRRADWYSDYLDWAIPAFRLVHSGVKPQTQIHTHMCYSEFGAIVRDIDNMDADVISFEASRSDLAIVDALGEAGFKTAVGPGVYDIHSPRVPGVEEIEDAIRLMLSKIQAGKLWVNPDCGLKTRGEAETTASLKNLVAAAKNVRKTL